MNEEESNPFKSLMILSGILLMLLLSATFISSNFPQDILINKESVIAYDDNILKFSTIDTSGANITINDVSYYAHTHDVIALGGRNSVTITGTPTVIATQTYYSGTLTIQTHMNHILLFDQNSISIPDDCKTITINYKDTTVALTSLGGDLFRITTGQSTYNILISKNTYFTDHTSTALYRMTHESPNYIITLVGYYDDNTFEITTSK